MDGITEEQRKYIARTKKARELRYKDNPDDFSQASVALAIGVARNTYTGYEIDRPMPQKYQAKFCAYLNINPDWLVTGFGPMEREDWAQKDVDFIRALEEEQIRELEQFAKFRFPQQFKKDTGKKAGKDDNS